MPAARAILRRPLRLPSAAYATATAFLSDTLDWLNLWHHHGATGGEPSAGFDATENHIFPRL